MSEWISANERLPELDGESVRWSVDVLVYPTDEYGSMAVAFYAFFQSGHGWRLFDEDNTLCPSVTHWMPLPAPPEVE